MKKRKKKPDQTTRKKTCDEKQNMTNKASHVERNENNRALDEVVLQALDDADFDGATVTSFNCSSSAAVIQAVRNGTAECASKHVLKSMSCATPKWETVLVGQPDFHKVSSPQHRRLCVLDWDDTLMPTCFWRLGPKPSCLPECSPHCELIHAIPDEDCFQTLNTEQWDLLQDKIIALIQALQATSDVVIVTNADVQWINQCLIQLPRVSDFFTEKQIVFMFARMYVDPEDLGRKFDCLRHFVSQFPKQWHEIVIVGDSVHDKRLALDVAEHEMSEKCLLIKLMAWPNLHQIMIEIDFLTAILPSYEFIRLFPVISIFAQSHPSCRGGTRLESVSSGLDDVTI
jgi:hypothetical protein